MTLRLLRRIARFPPLWALLKRQRVERVVATFLRSSAVEESGRFLVRELPRRQVFARYRLRGSRRPVFVRHATADVAVLDEVFHQRQYDLPAPARSLLEALGREQEILDLGGNIGLFGVAMLERFSQPRIVSFEPDPANAAVLRRCVEANDATGCWEVVEAAASNRDGEVPFASGGFSVSRIEPEDGEDRVSSVDVLPRLARADFAKIDIEGGEWAIVGDPRFADSAPPVLVLEYHPHLAPAEPRETALRIIREAGYALGPTEEFGPGHGLLWAWKELA